MEMDEDELLVRSVGLMILSKEGLGRVSILGGIFWVSLGRKMAKMGLGPMEEMKKRQCEEKEKAAL